MKILFKGVLVVFFALLALVRHDITYLMCKIDETNWNDDISADFIELDTTYWQPYD